MKPLHRDIRAISNNLQGRLYWDTFDTIDVTIANDGLPIISRAIRPLAEAAQETLTHDLNQ